MTGDLPLTLDLNGEVRTLEAPPWMTLADLLRDRMQLLATHIGCGEGVCGSCTVLLDGQAVRSCLTLALQANGRAVSTVESYASEDLGREIQEAFIQHHAAQCGFCTSGMLAVARAYLEDKSVQDHTDERSIRAALDAVICRCTGYQPIVAAVKAIAKRHRETAHD